MTKYKGNLKAVVLNIRIVRAGESSPWKVPIRKSQNSYKVNGFFFPV